jgi:hypothetical protein
MAHRLMWAPPEEQHITGGALLRLYVPHVVLCMLQKRITALEWPVAGVGWDVWHDTPTSTPNPQHKAGTITALSLEAGSVLKGGAYPRARLGDELFR